MKGGKRSAHPLYWKPASPHQRVTGFPLSFMLLPQAKPTGRWKQQEVGGGPEEKVGL